MASKGDKLSDMMCGFNLDMYHHVTSDSNCGNMFMSPSSMFMVLTMIHVGARNDTAKQMKEVLKLTQTDQKSVLSEMEKLIGKLKEGSKSVTLSTANRLYPHTDKTILEEYLSLVTKHFHADLKSMDYTSDAEGARLEINKWVEDVTNSKIKDLLPSGSLNSLTAMVVVNAIYFKGNWATQFKPEATSKMMFSPLKSAAKSVDMMRAKVKKVKYGENQALSCKVLEMPYVGEELSMIVILPNNNDGLPALEKKLTLNLLQRIVKDIHPATVDILLPKFKLESSLELKAALSALGMPDLFDEVKADLSAMGKELFVSKIFHKAFVDVNEEGTEAAAATAAVMQKRSLPIVLSFKADHPFMFMIWDHRFKIPLFIGRLVDPPSGDASMEQSKDEL
ncbi:hypothetical protein ACF0H5_009803 [Mactra antiquata]